MLYFKQFPFIIQFTYQWQKSHFTPFTNPLVSWTCRFILPHKRRPAYLWANIYGWLVNNESASGQHLIFALWHLYLINASPIAIQQLPWKCLCRPRVIDSSPLCDNLTSESRRRKDKGGRRKSSAKTNLAVAELMSQSFSPWSFFSVVTQHVPK